MFPISRYNSAMAPAAAGPMNRLGSLFDHVFGDDGGFTSQAWSGTPVAIWEDDNHVFIEADLPGVSDEGVEVTVHNGVLFIRGERKPGEGRRYRYNGLSYGRFERVITLPEAVDTEAVKATLTNGVLRIDLPKSPEAKPKKISIRTE